MEFKEEIMKQEVSIEKNEEEGSKFFQEQIYSPEEPVSKGQLQQKIIENYREDTKAKKSKRKGKGGPSRYSNRLKDKERVSYEETSEEYDLSAKDVDFQSDEAAAINADLNPYEMGPIEKRELPQFVKYPGPYVEVRNHILKLWHQDVNNYVTLRVAMKDIQDKYKAFVLPIFQFLKRFGYINTGVLVGLNSERIDLKKTVIVVGAGMAGLAASRQLNSFGYKVILIEARERVGGRVNTDWSTGGGIDLGASIITGLEGNPLTNVCKQLKTKLHRLKFDCPLYDSDGKRIDEETDQKIEKEFNSILEQSSKQKSHLSPSLGDAIFQLMEQRQLSDMEKRVIHWHIANLEYACATPLNKVSLHHWDQDDKFEWAGDHCLLQDGYSSIAKELARDINIRFNSVVSCIEANGSLMRVHTSNGIISGDAVVVTLPLGVLKEGTVKFSPPLPEWKSASINNLGFGLLNKVVILFNESFWEENLDYFGQVSEDLEMRGECYLFWNLQRCMGKPVLVALLAGQAAYNSETMEKDVVVDRVLVALRKRFIHVPQPIRSIVTRWYSDKFSRGTYSYIAVGSTGDDYDILAQPVDNRLFFAGEATIREHPATAAGAYLSGLRVAGLVDKSFFGDIKIDFDVASLNEDWIRERGASNKRRKSRYEDYSVYSRGKRGMRVKRTLLNESYSWLFTSSYRIPKKQRISPKKLSPKSTQPQQNNVNQSNDARIIAQRNDLMEANRFAEKDKKILFSLFQQRESERMKQETFTSNKNVRESGDRENRDPKYTKVLNDIKDPRSVSFASNTQISQLTNQPHKSVSILTSFPPSYNVPYTSQVTNNSILSLNMYPQPINVIQNSQGKKNHKVSKEVKNRVSENVIKYLNKFTVEGKLKSKEDFKNLARKLTHLCPFIQQSPNGLEQSSAKALKQQVSDNVITCLAKYLKDKSVLSKEEFKKIARKVTHAILLKEKNTRTNS